MAMTEKWRVVTEFGDVRSFVVLPPAADHIPMVDGGGHVAYADDAHFHGDGYTAREAVTLLAVSVMGLAVVEIRAPGEETTAEQLAGQQDLNDAYARGL